MFLIKPKGERRKQGVGEESELCSIYYLDIKIDIKNIFEKHESNFLSDIHHKHLYNNFVPAALKLQQHLVKDLLIYLQCFKYYIF